MSDTKERIFDISVEMISALDYESVNLREVAKRAGIKAASIYNHFISKREILDAIYTYYKENFVSYRKSESELRNIIDIASAEEIINALAFTFEGDSVDYRRMILITKIIYMRIVKDADARDIFLTLMTAEQEKYLTDLLDYGVKSGRFRDFDTKTFAKVFVGSRHIMGITAFARPTYEPGQLGEESDIIKLFSKMLPITDPTPCPR